MRIGKTRRVAMCLMLATVLAIACGSRVTAQENPAPAAPAVAAPAAAAAPATPAKTAAVAPGLEVKDQGQKPESHASMSFWQIVSRAGWFGELVWLSLIVCSIICVALIIDSYMTIQEAKIAPPSLVQK